MNGGSNFNTNAFERRGNLYFSGQDMAFLARFRAPSAARFPSKISHEKVDGYLLLAAGAAFLLGSLALFQWQGEFPSRVAVFGGFWAGVAILHLRQSVIFYQGHFVVQGMLTTRQFAYSQIANVEWMIHGRGTFGIRGITLRMDNERLIYLVITNELGDLLHHAAGEVERAGVSTLTWLPFPDIDALDRP